MDTILKTIGLTKQYKGKKAVDGVDITVGKGDIYGFLGQNGAGKTTTIRMIMGLVRPTSGEVELFGQRIRHGDHSHFDRIGSIIEYPGFYPNLTASENLEIHRRLMGVAYRGYMEEALEITGLTDVRNKRVGSFSLGMRQRLGLARALLHKPELLILDEPANGLDPAGIKELRSLLSDLSQKKKVTVFISSHILSEIQQLAVKIGIIHQGRLLEEISQKELEKRNRHYLELKVDNDKKAAFLLENSLGISDYKIVEQGVLRIYERLGESAAINRLLSDNGLLISGLNIMNDTLEDYFLQMTGSTYNV